MAKKQVGLPTVDKEQFKGKMPWEKRAKLIHAAYPSTVTVDFEKVFRVDPAVMGRIIADIQKREAAPSGKPGKIPAVNKEDADQYLRRYQNDDYTIHKFADAFKLLKGDRSTRAMAHKCKLAQTMVQRLLDGKAEPTVAVMENVARAFKKHPSFFVEYRVAYVVGMMAQRMEAIPEASIVPYLKLRGDAEKEWR